uniref:Protein G12 n=1 Tax=Clastoptera arizonana TaxID=38151 RepID=A0A1B6CUU2_9HEMI
MKICTLFILVLGTINIQCKELPTSVVADVRDLIDLIPCDLILSLFMEYVAVDVQVHKLLHYLTTDQFQNNLIMFKASEAYNETRDYLLPIGIDIHKGVEVLNNLIENAQEQRLRKRTPGHGVFGLIKESITLIPLEEMKDTYNAKLEENPDFQKVMEKILSTDLRNHIYDIMGTKHFEETINILNNINIPTAEIIDYIEETLVYFFDLDSKEDSR